MKIVEFIDFHINHFKKYKEKWNYEDGCVLKGALDLYHSTGEKKYLDFVQRYLTETITEDGKIAVYEMEEFNIDNINSGKVLFDFYEITKEEKYRKAIEVLYQQLENHPRTQEGSFWHKKIYPNQVWLDGLYMAMPFYAKYEKLFNASKGFGDIYQQFMTVERRIKDAETGLYYHGYDESRKERWSNPDTGLSLHFWGRAMGWFVMALVDTLEIIEADFSNAEEIKKIFVETIDALLKYQDKASSMWYQVVDQGTREGNYLETSGTLMIAYGILKGVRLGYLPENYRTFGQKAFDGTVEKYLDTENQQLKGICGVAGLGNVPYRDGSYEYYISEAITPNDYKGLGAFLMAYSETLAYNKDNDNSADVSK
ncbi:glycoside hydrolase family 88/105 protein [Clostridium formicaceticum]|uniref:Glycosyl hydrolase family 88 n=1 Tax=Clostridium formicaceticum TaxID=1497 RepID=A0AAC9RI24_9CLOT|nr:glycoside hydrolase family 88 protein [Clostridium formicaceticum]AOY76079.1 glycosyl hydrolase family 88 [Clostridium formicaceticum]ARE86441.1 Unsaturated rhamnogalacturonyl hydrolase YteR [Clostridium formicaceticum]